MLQVCYLIKAKALIVHSKFILTTHRLQASTGNHGLLVRASASPLGTTRCIIPKEIDVDALAVEFCTVDDSAFLIHYASDAEIHVTLGLAGSTVPQSATVAASAVAFHLLLVAFFVATSANCRVPRQPPLGLLISTSFYPASDCIFLTEHGPCCLDGNRCRNRWSRNSDYIVRSQKFNC